jgi:hypothetical protein
MRTIDDVIEFVKNHPHISRVQKQILITRLEIIPSDEEIKQAITIVNRGVETKEG